MPIRLTTEKFIKKANKIHNNKYNYSKVNYINSHTKITIICKSHGEFKQKPYKHLQKQGCPHCANQNKGKKISEAKRKNTIWFIKKANKIHNNKYDYSLTKYINATTKVKIICKQHGIFKQVANEHLRGSGCPKCAGNIKYTEEFFIEQCKKIHNNKYDYSKVKYVNAHSKINIICPKHGEFKQRASDHLNGHGCPKCYNKISHYEDEIYEFIKSNITNNIIRNSRKIISPYEIDIYLPEFKVGIEFNGKYWHSMDRKPFNYHQKKFNLCKEKGIYLIHIFEEDYIKWKDDIYKEIECCCKKVSYE